MKKISKKLLHARMDNIFLNYCYHVSALTHDYLRNVADIGQNESEERKELSLQIERDTFNAKVAKASEKFNKGVALWGYLYDGKPLIEDDLQK